MLSCIAPFKSWPALSSNSVSLSARSSLAFLVKAQSDAQIKVAQLQSDNEQFQAKLMADTKKASEDLALKLTELELKAGQDLNGAMQDNMLVFDPATGDFVNANS